MPLPPTAANLPISPPSLPPYPAPSTTYLFSSLPSSVKVPNLLCTWSLQHPMSIDTLPTWLFRLRWTTTTILLRHQKSFPRVKGILRPAKSQEHNSTLAPLAPPRAQHHTHSTRLQRPFGSRHTEEDRWRRCCVATHQPRESASAALQRIQEPLCAAALRNHSPQFASRPASLTLPAPPLGKQQKEDVLAYFRNTSLHTPSAYSAAPSWQHVLAAECSPA